MVMKFGLKPPTTNANLVSEQMWLAHRYRNVLTEIERGRRAAVRSLLLEQCEGLPEIQQAVKDADERVKVALAAVKGHKSKNRTRKVPEDLRTDLDRARIAKRKASEKWKEAKSKTRSEQVQLKLDEINARASDLLRSARAHSGLYWGTYLLVEAAMDAARKTPYWGRFVNRVWYPTLENDPSFVRWNGEGRLGVQIQAARALPCELVHAFDTRVQIHLKPDGRPPRPNGKPRPRYGTLRLRVGSDGVKPIWAEWPILMHRPMPAGEIKWASVTLRKIGPREQWHVEITVDNEFNPKPCGIGVVAINLGWRVVPDGIRVAYAIDGEGNTDELILSHWDISALQKDEDLRSIRDKRFNDAVRVLRAFKQDNKVPDWLAEKTRYAHSWREQRKLASVVKTWSTNRFEGDEDVFEVLERWAFRDDHLWRWESDQRAKSRYRRREIYRAWAARLADRYTTIVLNEHDMRDTAKKPAPDVSKDNERSRANRQLVAPSTLRLALVNAKRTRDGSTVQIRAAKVTKTCHACGHENDFDSAASIEHTCSSCGERWDQDKNACHNIMSLFRERPHDTKILGTARKLTKLDENGKPKETKRQRVVRLRKEKEARKATARDPQCNQLESNGI